MPEKEVVLKVFRSLFLLGKGRRDGENARLCKSKPLILLLIYPLSFYCFTL